MIPGSFPFGKYLIPSLLLAAIGYLLFKVQDILLPFILGMTLAYLISPLVRFFEVQGLRRRPVAILIFGGLLTLFSFGTYLTVNLASQEASKAAQELPRYVERGQRMFRDLQVWAARPSEKHSEPSGYLKRMVSNPALLDQINAHGRTLPDTLLRMTPTLASHVLPFVEMLFLVPLIAFFLLLEGPALLENVLRLVSARYVEMFLNIIFEIDNTMGNYVRGLCLKSFLVGLVALAGFWLIGLDYSIQLAGLAALTNVVPIFGPLVAGVLAVLVAFFQWGTLAGVLKVTAVCIALRLIDDGILQMVVFKNSVELHPIWILFSLMAGGALWGIWGLLFGMPLACLVKVLLGVLWEWYRSEYGLRYDDTPAEISHIPLI
ncbi:MAG: AI-2E family transporter [Elusimicrobiota bacterium]|jgi:predicted PurR-regulated permease PerM